MAIGRWLERSRTGRRADRRTSALMALICDTGPLLAALDSDDPDHARCATLLTGAVEDLVVPALVLAELDYWCHKRGGKAAWIQFLDDVLEGRTA